MSVLVRQRSQEQEQAAPPVSFRDIENKWLKPFLVPVLPSTLVACLGDGNTLLLSSLFKRLKLGS